MSTVDNSFQVYNSLSQTEVRFTQGKSKLDLKLYQKNSMNKINFRSFLGKNFICSCQDKYKKIRIPLIAVFLKILQTKSQRNKQRLQKIKNLIYSQRLQDIVKKHGITVEQLFSNFAFALNELQMGSAKIESQLIKKINSEPFFDKIIMESFYQMFYDRGYQNNLTSKISKWIKQEIGISVVFVQNQIDTQNDSLIFLRKNQKHQTLRALKSFSICSMTSIFDDSKQNVTPVKKTDAQRLSVKNKGTESLLKSISSCESPTLRRSSKSKQNENYVAISMQNSLQVVENKQNCFDQQKQQSETCGQEVQARRQKQSENRFWRMFCCRGD